jgi:hypothetical protein
MKLIILFCTETSDQEALQCNRIVVLMVMRAIEQRDIAVACSFQNRAP